jgi:hypothetical protein
MISEGYYVICQPKYVVPCVFDLNERGMFRSKPSVTNQWGYRIIASENLEVKLQYVCLIEKHIADPKGGVPYDFVLEEVLVDLDQDLSVDPEKIKDRLPETAASEILSAHEEWRNGYLPVKSDSAVETGGLSKKLRASIGERKEQIRKHLARKNSPWINAALPRLIQNFQRGLYRRVEDRLYAHYQQLGGEDFEWNLIRKMMQFFLIFEPGDGDALSKPDGGRWKNEDEAWDCWVGVAGSVREAQIIFRTMDAALRPLVPELAEEAAAG